MNPIYQENPIILGLMRLEKISVDELADLIRGSFALGIHYFDISDVYMNHAAESKLGEVIKKYPQLRKEMYIQTKCGLVKNEEGRITKIDLSYDHIMEAAKESLKRMNLEYLDCLLLHRVDIFMDSKEIAQAFDELYKQGLVRHFGVSNMDASMLEYLRSEVKVPLEIDQLQVSLGQPSLISQAFNVNFPQQVPNLADGLFFYLKKNHIILQCWSPFQVGFFEGSIFNKEKLPLLNQTLDELAKKYHSTPCGIATSFLSMLGSHVQVITGSMKLEHVKEAVDGSKLRMSKEDWYSLYCSTGNLLP